MDEGACSCGRPECSDKLDIAENQLFSLTYTHVSQARVQIVHGDQRSASWHANRVGRIGGSNVCKVAANRDGDSKLKSAKAICYVTPVVNLAAREAVKWGIDHESTALYQYAQMLRNGTTIKVYSGPLELFKRKSWSKKATAGQY
jgi:hypothetical protein